ncbi:MAG: hypothetical protein J1F64_08145 [Oscillospiraceae bacterium]|nr:hypothetical protein [Oscillospiraceae bacterium]
MEDFEKSRKYMLVIVFTFFTLPLFFMFLKEGVKESIIFGYLYALNPIAVFAVSVLYAVRCGFDPKFPLVVGAIFIPAVFIYFDWHNIVFGITYAVFSYIGTAVGVFFRRFL